MTCECWACTGEEQPDEPEDDDDISSPPSEPSPAGICGGAGWGEFRRRLQRVREGQSAPRQGSAVWKVGASPGLRGPTP